MHKMSLLAMLMFATSGGVALAAESHAHAHGSSAPKCDQLTVYVAKQFYTMNPGRPTGKAVAVCNERIVSIGNSLEDLKP